MKKIRTLRKRLFFDIETSPNIGLFFAAGYKKNIGYESIIKERAIICICYKWEDSKEVYSLQWDNNQCDKAMLKEFVKVADTSDEIIGHNGDKFDLAWIRTRCLYHGIDMFPTYTTIDTLKISRSKFMFNSNKLDYISKFLHIGKKIKTDFSLWKKILLDSDPVAMAKMVKYCKNDVVILEKVFTKLNRHIMSKTHYGVIFGTDKTTCPECGSDDYMKHGTRTTTTGLQRQRLQCKTCHHFYQNTIK
jgi:uncharacterized protein YprB with RNaseH-like and TPR domain